VILIAVVAGTIVVGGICVSLTTFDSGGVTYNYETKEVTSFEYTSSIFGNTTSSPSSGNKYIVAHVIINNVSSGELSLRLSLFELKCSNGITYSYSISSSSYSSKSSDLYSKTLNAGAKYDYYIVYEVPNTVTAVDLVKGSYTSVKKDTSLTVPSWIYPSSPNSSTKILYNYQTISISSFNHKISGYTYTETPSTGNKFIVVHITVKNESYSKDAPLSLALFNLKCSNNITYGYDALGSYYYSSKSNGLYDINLGTGASYDYYVVYEVPIGVNAVSLEKYYTYSPYSLYELNTSLSIPTWVYPS